MSSDSKNVFACCVKCQQKNVNIKGPKYSQVPKFKKKWQNYINISFRDKLLSIFKEAVTAKSKITNSGEDFEIKEDHSDFFRPKSNNTK